MINQELLSHLKGKTILITGGSGFFGKNLCEKLLQFNQSHLLNLKIVSLSRSGSDFEGVTTLKHDVTKKFDFDLTADYIIHAATPVYSNEIEFNSVLDIIINGTQNVLEFAERSKAKRTLLVSSGAVYGEQNSPFLDEEMFLQEPFFDPKSAYVTGKRISEIYAVNWHNQSKGSMSIARCFAFSGKHIPLSEHFAITSFIKNALFKNEIIIKGDGRAIRSYMDADDLTDWLITLLVLGQSGQIYNVGSDQEISVADLAREVSKLVSGSKVTILNETSATIKNNRYVPSIAKAKKLHGLILKVSLKDSLKKMIEFYKGLDERNR